MCAHKIGTDAVLLGTWVQSDEPLKILDIGSGSGVISFILAQRFPMAQILGIELDETSYSQSLENLEVNPWKDRIEFQMANFLDFDFQEKTFDLIISNPPFFHKAFLSGNETRDKARHTFSLSHDQILEKAKELLNTKGKLAMILPYEEGSRIIQNPFLDTSRVCEIRNKPSTDIVRLILEWSQPSIDKTTEEFSIRNEEGNYSSFYKNLTQSFYLNF